MPDWLRIKQARDDLTDYVIHWTRSQSIDGNYLKPFEVLKLILKSGVLKPSFAPKRRWTVGGSANTIQGDYPAVCFTEQPLDAFIKSCTTLTDRYQQYAVAVRKDRLFEYGGRPAIYGDEGILKRLPEDDKYLWVRFNPIPNPVFGGYPVDWTHEREWRARVRSSSYGTLGTSPEDGVPLLLPINYASSSKPVLHLPVFLVSKSEEVEELRECIDQSPPYDGNNGVLGQYFQELPHAPIVPLDVVTSRISDGDRRWARLDTLPYGEFDPVNASQLTKFGWNTLQ